jgi:hypothetical protein
MVKAEKCKELGQKAIIINAIIINTIIINTIIVITTKN